MEIVKNAKDLELELVKEYRWSSKLYRYIL